MYLVQKLSWEPKRDDKMLKLYFGRVQAKCKEFNGFYCQAKRVCLAEPMTKTYTIRRIPCSTMPTERRRISSTKKLGRCWAWVKFCYILNFDKRQKGSDGSSNSSWSSAPEDAYGFYDRNQLIEKASKSPSPKQRQRNENFRGFDWCWCHGGRSFQNADRCRSIVCSSCGDESEIWTIEANPKLSEGQKGRYEQYAAGEFERTLHPFSQAQELDLKIIPCNCNSITPSVSL